MSVALAVQLREGTKKSHTMAENTGFVSCFLKGVVDKASYRKLVADLYFVYTAMELSAHGLKSQTVDAVQGVLVAPESPEAVLDAMAENSTKIVSLTITEKGYCRRGTQAATGRAALPAGKGYLRRQGSRKRFDSDPSVLNDDGYARCQFRDECIAMGVKNDSHTHERDCLEYNGNCSARQLQPGDRGGISAV